ncbi:MAG: hypothetical protein JSR82_20970 [Verrucomicrobia bacterium]|nr:hypothetical protein [Verrucomicrobiota bacterium]
MTLTDVTFQGPPVLASALPPDLPKGYAFLLPQINGFVAFDGGLHVRGICTEPAWHSLEAAWRGPQALHTLFPALRPSDVPFGQDFLGDQFVLRGGLVFRLCGESGELEPLQLAWSEFLHRLEEDPAELLELGPLQQFRRSGGELAPGQLLSAMPPFITKDAAKGVFLKPVPVADRLAFLAQLAKSVAGRHDGQVFSFQPDE